MARKKKEPKVEKVFKGKKDEKTEVPAEEELLEEKSTGSNIDDFLGVEEAPEDKLTEKQKKKLEKINAVKSKISKILQSSNVEIVDENFDDDYEASDTPGMISQEDYDSLKSMYGSDKNKKAEVTLTIDDFDYMYVGQYLEEYDLMHMKNIKRVKIQRKRSPKLKKFLIISSMVIVVAVGAVLGFLFTRKEPVVLKSVTLNQTSRTYYTDEDFDDTGLYFIAEYSDGAIQRIKLDDESHFNGDLSTGKFERVGEEEKKIKFVNNGTANLVFSYQGFNVNYEVTVKKKTETGIRAIYSEGLYKIAPNGVISEDKLKIAINYEGIGYTRVKYSSSTSISVYVDGQKCSQSADGYIVANGTTDGSLIVIKYLGYELILDQSKDLVQI